MGINGEAFTSFPGSSYTQFEVRLLVIDQSISVCCSSSESENPVKIANLNVFRCFKTVKRMVGLTTPVENPTLLAGADE